MKKRYMALLCVLVALASFIGGQTLAYFTAQDSVTNTFTVGSLDIDENESDWDDEEDGKNIYAGYVHYKNPTVKNLAATGGNPAYMRLRVKLEDGNPAGSTVAMTAERAALIWNTIYYDSAYTGTYAAEGTTTSAYKEGDTPLQTSRANNITLPHFNEGDFTQQAVSDTEKVYTYKRVLDPQDEVKLFSTIIVPSDWTSAQLEQMGKYRIVIELEAIQSQGFEDATAAFAALNEALAASNGSGDGNGGGSGNGSGNGGN